MEDVREDSPVSGETSFSLSSAGQASIESVTASILAEFDLFDCCICLNLIFKPVVLACGHTSCFWCIHLAMNSLSESNCPICRKPYKYFPAICLLLHSLLWKLKPSDYKKQEEEVLKMEKERNMFSPQFMEDVSCRTNENPPQDSNTSCKIPQQVSISDLLCAGCSQFLFRPAVLNCGHVYCELCMLSLRKERLRCLVCGILHPGDPPLVCLSLNSFLEKQFPVEFAARSASLQATQSLPSAAAETEQDVEPPPAAETEKDVEKPTVPFPMVHFAVGCDLCGMYPITGLRYTCTDCTEKAGFDLCEGCFKARPAVPARFNQRHTPDHSFRRDDSMIVFGAAGEASGPSQNPARAREP